MWYKNKVVPSVVNSERELVVRISHPGSEHWKSFGRLIGYLKGKETKRIFNRNPKVIKTVMFGDYNYATDKETRKSVIGLVSTLVGTLITCQSKDQRTVTLSSTYVENVELLACAQEVKFISMLLLETTEVNNPSVLYETNKGDILLAQKSQVGMRTKHIDMCQNFMGYMVEDKYIEIVYIRNE